MKKAKIIEIKENVIKATINVDSMCGDCPSSHGCFIKDCSKRTIEIKTKEYRKYKIGDEICVDINNKSSFYALLFAYILPLVLLLFVFYGLLFLGVAEINCGIYAIISLIPYYFLLFLNQEKINNRIEVKIYDN